MNTLLNARHEALVRATQPHLIRPRPVRLEMWGAGYPKRLYRELKAAYADTHKLLAGVCYDLALTPDLLVRAVDNHRKAQALLSKAAALPRTHLGARTRALALDNADVAREVLEAIANIANRAPRPAR